LYDFVFLSKIHWIFGSAENLWFSILLIIGFFIGLIMSSFIEYEIHKHLLHRTPKFLMKNKYVKKMWQGHVLSHHANYIPDKHYKRDDTNKEEVLTFSWYEGALIVIVCTLFVYGVASSIRLLLGLPLIFFMPEVIGSSVAFALYYTAYESLHAIMHVPYKFKWLHKTKIMKWLNRHHYQHHLEPNTNLNVVLPIADYVFGTKHSLPEEKYIYADAFIY